jgi:hypothetical protein
VNQSRVRDAQLSGADLNERISLLQQRERELLELCQRMQVRSPPRASYTPAALPASRRRRPAPLRLVAGSTEPRPPFAPAAQATHTHQLSELHSSAEARCTSLRSELESLQQELSRTSMRADSNEYRASRYISLLIREEQRAMRLGADRAALLAKLVHTRLSHLPGPLTLAVSPARPWR